MPDSVRWPSLEYVLLGEWAIGQEGRHSCFTWILCSKQWLFYYPCKMLIILFGLHRLGVGFPFTLHFQIFFFFYYHSRVKNNVHHAIVKRSVAAVKLIPQMRLRKITWQFHICVVPWKQHLLQWQKTRPCWQRQLNWITVWIFSSLYENETLNCIKSAKCSQHLFPLWYRGHHFVASNVCHHWLVE